MLATKLAKDDQATNALFDKCLKITCSSMQSLNIHKSSSNEQPGVDFANLHIKGAFVILV